MPSFEHKENSGSLFRNERKTTENQPDYRGSCLINGVALEIAAWVKESNTGTKYFSFKFQEPRVKQEAKGSAQEISQEDVPC